MRSYCDWCGGPMAATTARSALCAKCTSDRKAKRGPWDPKNRRGGEGPARGGLGAMMAIRGRRRRVTPVELHTGQPVIVKGRQYGPYHNRFGIIVASAPGNTVRVRVALPGGAWRTTELPASALHVASSDGRGRRRKPPKDLHVYLPWNTPKGKLRVAQARVPGGPTKLVIPKMARQHPTRRR